MKVRSWTLLITDHIFEPHLIDSPKGKIIAHPGLCLHTEVFRVQLSPLQQSPHLTGETWCRNRWENDDDEMTLYFFKSPFPSAIFWKDPCASPQFLNPSEAFIKPASLQESFFREEGKWEWSEVGGEGEDGARMGGMKEGVQSIWEVTVCNWMSGKIYRERTGESLWMHARTSLRVSGAYKMQNDIVQKYESLSGKCLTGGGKKTIDRLMDKMEGKHENV